MNDAITSCIDTLCPTGAMFGKFDVRSGRSNERSWVYRCEAGVEDGRSGVDVGGSLLTCDRGSRRVFVVAGDSSLSGSAPDNPVWPCARHT